MRKKNEGILEDTNNIYQYYQNNLSPSVPLNYYAAGLCKQTIASYTDWYLPSICEMGYRVATITGCGTSSTPTTQNMQSNLSLTGNYWSSTEFSSSASTQAYIQTFDPTTPSQSRIGKVTSRKVRCVRVF